MGYWHNIYLGYSKDGKVFPLGPYDAKGRIYPIYTYRHIWAGENRLHDQMEHVLPTDQEVSDELRNVLAYETYEGKTIYPDMRMIALDNLPALPIMSSGYVPIAQVEGYESFGGDPDFYPVYTPMIYAEKLRGEMNGIPAQPVEGEDEAPRESMRDFMFYQWVDRNTLAYDIHKVREVARVFEDAPILVGTKGIVVIETVC